MASHRLATIFSVNGKIATYAMFFKTIFASKYLNMEDRSIDCKSYTAEEIISLLFDIYPELQNHQRKRKHVYIGMTNDIKRRTLEHNISIDEIIFYAQTANQRVAAKVEELAKELGFEIGEVEHGGNGTNSYSIYIYAYVITKYSRQ